MAGEQKTRYQFSSLGYVEGITAFKEKYLESIKSSLAEKNPNGKSITVLDGKTEKGRTIIHHVADTGSSIIFACDFHYLEGNLYVASETIELAPQETRDIALLIDQSFLNSVDIQKN